ncbi:MAG: glycosyltransferase [Candidatus Sedimenticola endophacoides]
MSDAENWNMEDLESSTFFLNSRITPGTEIQKSVPIWNKVAKRYQEHLDSKCDTVKIPKVIHQIWLGSRFPRKYKSWSESIRRQNPDCEYILWDEKRIDEINLLNRTAFDKSPSLAVKSDIARIEILHQYGGMYFDTDFELFTKIPDLYLSTDFVVGLVFSARSNPVFGSSFLFSVRDSMITKNLIESIREPLLTSEPETVMNYIGPYKITDILLNAIQHGYSDYLVLPSNILYPWPSYMRNDFNRRYKYLTEQSIGIHHWEISWVPIWKKLLSRTSWQLKAYVKKFKTK